MSELSKAATCRRTPWLENANSFVWWDFFLRELRLCSKLSGLGKEEETSW
jgi:hypothetical protein